MAYWMYGKISYAPWRKDSVEKSDWLDRLLPYIGTYIEEIRTVWYNGKRVRYQDLPFGRV